MRLGFLALVATLCVGTVARADSFGLPLETKRISLAGELSFYRDTEDDASRIDLLAPLLEFQYPWTDRWLWVPPRPTWATWKPRPAQSA